MRGEGRSIATRELVGYWEESIELEATDRRCFKKDLGVVEEGTWLRVSPQVLIVASSDASRSRMDGNVEPSWRRLSIGSTGRRLVRLAGVERSPSLISRGSGRAPLSKSYHASLTTCKLSVGLLQPFHAGNELFQMIGALLRHHRTDHSGTAAALLVPSDEDIRTLFLQVAQLLDLHLLLKFLRFDSGNL